MPVPRFRCRFLERLTFPFVSGCVEIFKEFKETVLFGYGSNLCFQTAESGTHYLYDIFTFVFADFAFSPANFVPRSI